MARLESITDEALTRRFVSAFRNTGYAGTALRDLAEAAGLTKAALYHRFPAGKDAMAAAALTSVCQEMEASVLSLLKTQTPLPTRLRAMMAALQDYYAKGTHACLLELFSQHSAPISLRNAVRRSTDLWITAVAEALAAHGMAPELARLRARDALIAIQGTLVVCRALDDRQAFTDLLTRLPEQLMAPAIDLPQR